MPLVHHIDDAAIAALREYGQWACGIGACRPFARRPGADVLDLCSSWMGQNPQLDAYDVRDLNAEPSLPYDDAA
eukprot:gene45859-47859_t